MLRFDFSYGWTEGRPPPPISICEVPTVARQIHCAEVPAQGQASTTHGDAAQGQASTTLEHAPHAPPEGETRARGRRRATCWHLPARRTADRTAEGGSEGGSLGGSGNSGTPSGAPWTARPQPEADGDADPIGDTWLCIVCDR